MTDISIVIPLFNEDESLGELHQWIRKVMNSNNFSYEVIYIDDGSNDKSWDVLQNLKKEDSNVKAVRFQRNYGKSAALHVGFDMAVGEVVVTMDADLQDSPEEIPDLRKMILVDGFDLVSGWKKKRYDPISKTIPTKLFNWTTRKMSGIYLHDFNCGLKIYRKNVIKSLEIFGEMHRYIPVIAHKEGFRKIGEKVVEHRARKYGVSKFAFINMVLAPILYFLLLAFIKLIFSLNKSQTSSSFLLKGIRLLLSNKIPPLFILKNFGNEKIPKSPNVPKICPLNLLWNECATSSIRGIPLLLAIFSNFSV
jgi:glycosyltransferase involved in cell wall biosynthesis